MNGEVLIIRSSTLDTDALRTCLHQSNFRITVTRSNLQNIRVRSH